MDYLNSRSQDGKRPMEDDLRWQIFNFNLFIHNFFMKQINWYMYLMQNADTYFSNLHVSWLFCFAHSISCTPPPPRRVNMQFRELIRQFVVFQYQLFSFFIYSSCFWYRPSMQVYCWHCCNESFPLSAALHVSVSCSKLERN